MTGELTPESWQDKEADCAEVLADIYVYLDQECDSEREAVLQRHLDDCGPCLERYGIERQLKALLHRKCGCEQAPSQLRDRLKASLRQAVVDSGESVVRISETRVEVERDNRDS